MVKDTQRGVRLIAATFTEIEFQPYALAVGQIALAWNDAFEALGLLYLSLLGIRRTDGDRLTTQHIAVWQSVKSDRIKREMIRAALEFADSAMKRRYPKANEEILWLLGRLNSFEDIRNDIVHAPLHLVGHVTENRPITHEEMLASATVEPLDWFLNFRAGKISDQELLAYFEWLRASLILLRDHATHVDQCIGPALRAWPDRPDLPNRPETKTPPPPHQAQRKGRQPPPRS